MAPMHQNNFGKKIVFISNLKVFRLEMRRIRLTFHSATSLDLYITDLTTILYFLIIAACFFYNFCFNFLMYTMSIYA